ncbi:hypothetical protein AF72_02625 [Xylella taiwanensis]|uniref:Uncharacterized protein n=1 Tax=Xylella taiwanensis TaxID=1444770 RepID=Z9JL28_9GAMM|nr:hypothetical protein AF72_02625 [Xylella taiwanensis]
MIFLLSKHFKHPFYVVLSEKINLESSGGRVQKVFFKFMKLLFPETFM